MFMVRAGSSLPIGYLGTSNIEIAGYNWNLYSGTDSNQWKVFSFMLAGDSDYSITKFNADLNQFFGEFYWLFRIGSAENASSEFLTKEKGLPNSQVCHRIA